MLYLNTVHIMVRVRVVLIWGDWLECLLEDETCWGLFPEMREIVVIG